MIRIQSGDLLRSDAEALVNPVNTVGVMGAGLAAQFKRAYPENFRAYYARCMRGEMHTGRMFVTRVGLRWIINFPTKEHWRHPSRIEWIAEGLRDLRAVIEREDIRSIAIPALGAGLGGVPLPLVQFAIVTALDDLDGVDIIVYRPLP